jgi:mRNA interferase MazF
MCGHVSCIRKARLNERIGTIHPQELRRVRLGVAAVIGLTDLLTAQGPNRPSQPWRIG